jgi:hypothetical protein
VGLAEQGFYFQLVEIAFGGEPSGSIRALAPESNLYCLTLGHHELLEEM